MSKALNDLIKQISDAGIRATKNKADVGELLLTDICRANASTPDQEKAIMKLINTVIKAVNGFDDYRESFWSLDGFFERIINKYSAKVVLHTVKACNTVYNTKRSSDNLVTGWANASTSRYVVWLNTATPEEIASVSFLQTIKDVRAILVEVVDAGKEFHDIIKSNPDLKESITKIKEYLDHPAMGGKKLKADEKATLKLVKKEISHIEGLASEVIITAFEQAVDMDRPSGSLLLKATNMMVFKKEADLALQVRAAQGPLAQLAVQAIFNQTEANPGEEYLLTSAVAFIQTLLVPWQREDSGHIATKKQIATVLLELNLLEALFYQLRFWKVEWKCSFGNSADCVVVALLELARYFPEIIEDKIKPDVDVVGFIRTCAERYRSTTYRAAYETAFSGSEILECLLDGKPEPPPPTAEEMDRRIRPWLYNGSFNY